MLLKGSLTSGGKKTEVFGHFEHRPMPHCVVVGVSEEGRRKRASVGAGRANLRWLPYGVVEAALLRIGSTVEVPCGGSSAREEKVSVRRKKNRMVCWTNRSR